VPDDGSKCAPASPNRRRSCRPSSNSSISPGWCAAPRRAGLGNQFLGHLREVDAIAISCAASRRQRRSCRSSVDPGPRRETVETELMLADLDSLERRLVAVQKRVRGGEREAKISWPSSSPSSRGCRRAGQRAASRCRPSSRAIELLQLLTAKPVLYIANIDEGAAATARCEPPGRRLCCIARGAGGDDLGGIEASSPSSPTSPSGANFSPRSVSPRLGSPGDPRRLFALGPDHLFHLRRKNPRPGRYPRHQGAAGRRGHPYRFEKGFIRPKRSLTRFRRLQRRAGCQGCRKMRLEGADYVVQDAT